MQNTLLAIGAVVVLIVAALFFFGGPSENLGSASPGGQATIATSSAVTIPAVTAVTLAATSSCASTIVQTAASAVMLLFTDKKGDTLNGINGTALQAASTTVAYDSGLYGCGRIRGYSYTAQIITISQSN